MPEFYKHTIVIYADQDLSDVSLKEIARKASIDEIHIEESFSEEVDADELPDDAARLFHLMPKDEEDD